VWKLRPHNSGVFYGQCLEICGAYPRFMSISLEFVSVKSKFSCYLLDDSGYERDTSGYEKHTDIE